MYKAHQEIFKQDESLKLSFDYVMSNKNDICSFFEMNGYEEIVFVACGSSYWLSLSALETFQEKFKIRCSAVTSGDVMMNPGLYEYRFNKPLIIVPSRSGNTTETINAIELLKQYYKCPVLAIVEYENSQLSRQADLLLSIPWANEQSICQTRSFSNLYLVCIMLAAVVKEDDFLLSSLSGYINSFRKTSHYTEEFVKNIFAENEELKGLITLGNGKLFGVICEGAYITVEMAQAPAHFYFTLEFRHGPIVLLDETYLVVLCSDGNQKELEENLIADVQSKGAKVLAITSNGNLSNADFLLSMSKEAPAEVVGLYASFVTQAIAYYKALSAGVNPDHPKDLVAWIQL